MNWTTEYPTKPGYYWTRNWAWRSSPHSIEEELCVVLVSPDLSFWHCASELLYDKSDIVSAEWYGPIEPPTEDTQPTEGEEEYCCGYNTVSGAFHKPGCTGECGFMNPGDAIMRRRIQRRKAKH